MLLFVRDRQVRVFVIDDEDSRQAPGSLAAFLSAAAGLHPARSSARRNCRPPTWTVGVVNRRTRSPMRPVAALSSRIFLDGDRPCLRVCRSEPLYPRIHATGRRQPWGPAPRCDFLTAANAERNDIGMFTRGGVGNSSRLMIIGWDSVFSCRYHVTDIANSVMSGIWKEKRSQSSAVGRRA